MRYHTIGLPIAMEYISIPYCAKVKDSIGHYSDVIMNVMVSQITGVSMVCPTVCKTLELRISGFCGGNSLIHWWPLNSPRKGPVTWRPFSKGPWCHVRCKICLVDLLSAYLSATMRVYKSTCTIFVIFTVKSVMLIFVLTLWSYL